MAGAIHDQVRCALIEYKLLAEFRKLFDSKQYKHRVSNLEDFVAMQLYEDLTASIVITGGLKVPVVGALFLLPVDRDFG